jgi:hypothetical protein
MFVHRGNADGIVGGGADGARVIGGGQSDSPGYGSDDPLIAFAVMLHPVNPSSLMRDHRGAGDRRCFGR